MNGAALTSNMIGQKTITVGKPAEKAHVKHGDTAGACATATVPETTMEETTVPETTLETTTTP